ncbi:ABC transporter substrate-binding protein [Vibrio sp.]|nr:ABC transporter substrate-binding protein [Vibrio sp.]
MKRKFITKNRFNALTVLPLLASAFMLQSANAASCTADASLKLIAPHTLNMATNPTLPPMQYVDDKGNLKGMRIELGEKIAKRLCLEPKYTRIEFSAMIPGLNGERWDMINTGIFYTAERAKMMYMVPYEEQAVSVSTLTDSASAIHNEEDLSGKVVGVEIGGFEESTLRKISKKLESEGKDPIDVRTFDNFTISFQALRAGQVDAVVTIDAVAAEYQHKGTFKQVLSGLEPTPVALAFKDKNLAAASAKVLNEMNKDGSLPELFNRYGAVMKSGTFAIEGHE